MTRPFRETGDWRNPCPICGATQPPCNPGCGFTPTDENIDLPLESPVVAKDVSVKIKQITAGVWDWQVDWTDEDTHTQQRSSGTSASFDVAIDRARHECVVHLKLAT